MAMTEKRAQPRQKALLHGIVYFDEGHLSSECVVRDISNAGARLRFPNEYPRAGSIELKIPAKNMSFKGVVRWQQGNEVGIDFQVDEQSTYVARLEAEITELKTKIGLLTKKLQTVGAA